MKGSKKLYPTLVIFLMVAPLFAQTKLTVDDAAALAVENNISVQQAQISLDLAEKQNRYSWNSVSPSLSISANESIPLTDSNVNNSSFSLSASASLRFSTSLITNIRAASFSYQNGKSAFEDAKRQVELNARLAFYNLLLMAENISQQKRNVESAERTYKSNLEKFNRGQLAEIDLLSSQYSYESLKPNLESTQINYENSLALFKQTLGLSQEEELLLDGSLEPLMNLSEINVDYDIEDLKSVKDAKTQVEVAKNSLLATRFSAYGPTLSASYSLPITSKRGDADFTKPFDGSYGSVSLGVSIPLDGWLPWSSGALSIENQKANLEKAQLMLENAKTTAQINIQNSIKKIRQAQSQLKSAQSNVELAQKTYDATAFAYSRGAKDLSALQRASDSLMSANTNLLSQVNTTISNILNLEYTLGLPYGTLAE